MNKKSLLFLIVFIAAYGAIAQVAGYKYFSKIETVYASGYYNIALDSAVSAHSQQNFNDVRIINYSHRWVPLLITTSANKNNNFITTYLNANEQYWLLLDNPNPEKAFYNFTKKDSISYFKFLKTAEIKLYPHPKVPLPVAGNYKWILWSVLAVILVTLAFFTRQMFAEIDKRKEHDHI